LDSFLAPAISRLPVKKETLFQQDGATCHTARACMAVVNILFSNHVFSRYGDTLWSTRSPDFSHVISSLGLPEIPCFQSSNTPHNSGVERRIREEVEQIPA
jgi:hypothetical protein